MPGVVRLTDLDVKNNRSPSVNGIASLDTYTNNLPTARFQDIRSDGGKNMGMHNVLVNKRFIQTCSDPTDSGAMQKDCSPTVIVN